MSIMTLKTQRGNKIATKKPQSEGRSETRRRHGKVLPDPESPAPTRRGRSQKKFMTGVEAEITSIREATSKKYTFFSLRQKVPRQKY